MSVSWSYFKRFDALTDLYMPMRGEGETLSSQMVTAINKLVYKWYNDGDVYDNVSSGMNGWANDLSSYANWLHKYAGVEIANKLEEIFECKSGSKYEDILMDVANMIFDEKELLLLDSCPAQGSIYKCEGPFEFCDEDEDDEYDI